MSRSNNVELKNPATRFFEWNGEAGGFRYYDKEIDNEDGTKGARVQVSLPFYFLVLDTLATVKGYSDHDKSGYWSNEVRRTDTETLTVKNKKGIQFEGFYKDMRLSGAKYSKSVYIVFLDGTEMKIGNIQFMGAALTAWIDFSRKTDVLKGAVLVKEMMEGKKGKTVYQIPVFTQFDVKPETDEKAKQFDKELQDYLTAYFARRNNQTVNEHVQGVDYVPPHSIDDIPAEHVDEIHGNFIDEAPF